MSQPHWQEIVPGIILRAAFLLIVMGLQKANFDYKKEMLNIKSVKRALDSRDKNTETMIEFIVEAHINTNKKTMHIENLPLLKVNPETGKLIKAWE